MKKKPEISVIIPTFNRENLLSQSIKSILSQSYQDFEIIVVDDASTDNTRKIVESFNVDKIRYIRHKKNKGGAIARNTGIKTAKGKYIAFQDSDDRWLPMKLEKQIKIFENSPPEIGLVYTGLWKIKGDKKIYIPSGANKKDGDVYKELLKRNFVAAPTILVSKRFLDKAGMFDKRLSRLQDWELAINLSRYCKFKYINKPLVISSYTSNSISSDREALIESFKIILAKYFKDISKNKKLLSDYYFRISVNLCSNGEVREGKKYLKKAFHACFWNIKILLVFFVLLFGHNFYSKVIEKYRKIKNE